MKIISVLASISIALSSCATPEPKVTVVKLRTPPPASEVVAEPFTVVESVSGDDYASHGPNARWVSGRWKPVVGGFVWSGGYWK